MEEEVSGRHDWTCSEPRSGRWRADQPSSRPPTVPHTTMPWLDKPPNAAGVADPRDWKSKRLRGCVGPCPNNYLWAQSHRDGLWPNACRPRKALQQSGDVLEFRGHRCVSKGRGTGAGSAVGTSGPLQQFIPGHGPALFAKAEQRAQITQQRLMVTFPSKLQFPPGSLITCWGI